MSWIVRDLLLERYGYSMPVETKSSLILISTVPVLICNANPRRVRLYIDNPSGSTVGCNEQVMSSSFAGRLIPTNGGLVIDWKDDLDLVTRAWWAAYSGVGTNINIIEAIITGADDTIA